jgi:hypothetical protein
VNAVLATPAVDGSSNQERLDHVAQMFVPNPGQNTVLLQLRKLVDASSSTRPVNMVLLAAPNFGKSEVLKHFERRTNPPFSYTAEKTEVPVVRVAMVDIQDPVGLLRTCLATLGVRYGVRDPADELWRRLKLHIEPFGIRVFIFDDAHNAADLRVAKQKELLKTLRGFGDITQRPIALAGTENLGSFLENDRQFRTRFLPISIPSIASKTDLQRFLKGFDERLDFPMLSDLSSRTMSELVYELVGLELGAVCQLVKGSAQSAIRSGAPKITPELMRAAADSVPQIHWKDL